MHGTGQSYEGFLDEILRGVTIIDKEPCQPNQIFGFLLIEVLNDYVWRRPREALTRPQVNRICVRR